MSWPVLNTAHATVHHTIGGGWCFLLHDCNSIGTEEIGGVRVANRHHWKHQGETGAVSAAAHHCQRWLHLHHDGSLVMT